MMTEQKTTVINLFGGPGSGKSSTAYLLAGAMKWDGFSCELVTEYAKDLVWEGDLNTLEDQLFVFAKQFHRLVRLKSKVEFIITDSPILLSLCYDRRKSPTLKRLALESMRSFDNVNVFLKRKKGYSVNGRLHTEEEAKQIDAAILQMLHDNGVEYAPLDSTKEAYKAILALVQQGEG